MQMTPRGSPPRAWGQCLARALMPRERRFTPTGVGTIPRFAVASLGRSVHPHGRGDNPNWRASSASRCGSPPRAWGQWIPTHPPRRLSRFTPTGVGTMALDRRPHFWHTVHPHGRGDNAPSHPPDLPATGSPPRAWGQFTDSFGNNDYCTVHPHGRGDNPCQGREALA